MSRALFFVMTFTDNQKINKLVGRIEALIHLYVMHEADFAVNRCIDRYYYIKKTVELRLIYEAFRKGRLSYELLVFSYRELYGRWRKDACWLNKRILFQIPCPQSFPYIPVL